MVLKPEVPDRAQKRAEELQSNHYGIETYNPQSPYLLQATLQSNHYGIETLLELSSDPEVGWLQSNHYGIETGRACP